MGKDSVFALLISRRAHCQLNAETFIEDECSLNSRDCSLSVLQQRARQTSSGSGSSDFLGSCQNARHGELCYNEVQWARTHGIHDHPGWYPGLTVASSDAEFQAQVHSKNPKKCPEPCLETQSHPAHAASEHCHDARHGELCYNEIQWARTHGVHEHPSWYPGLTAGSSDAEFQEIVHSKPSSKCPKPCAKGSLGIAPTAAPVLESFPQGYDEKTISGLQWNPHWECFVKAANSCGAAARASLNAILSAGFLDFAHIVMFEIEGYQPPEPYVMVKQVCGIDRVMLIYNSAHWTPSGSPHPICLQGNDRAGIVHAFHNKHGLKITVAGAHFPHPGYGNHTPIKEAIASLDGSKLLLLGDTNREYASGKLLCELNSNFCKYVISTELFDSCCNSDGFRHRGFDRVLANFGHNMQTEPHFQNVDWKVGEFHKGVVGTFT
eukprot:CAMPEP_0197703616 /NCGR_PEP_ID=MMETSP1338-20131121/125527_1 /TAXON_ID=43686 ORGANISM="Pelagodinium beii, Strain RCC1491" /NCGR_SAMPLE_ID=MMETSP1338 /ASSEMBLY_ACC=CAM_ASM_000754 /LENGTH=435 /DNA_ID=CAMNT_0043287513 /DNA_START=306 /DNA_END=1610 /DNA_ORIENTATION=-